jgi:dihydrodipicolinate synthase/N-acetylneuraminate lyase
MIKAAQAESEKQSRELVSVASLTGSSESSGSQKPAPTPDGGGKASSPSSSAISMIGKLKTRKKEVGFQVMVGNAQQLKSSLDIGAAGAILGFACPAPMACYEIYAAFKDGDKTLSDEKQNRIKLTGERIVGELGVPAIKYAMDLNGYFGGPSRLPFLPLTGEQKAEIERLMSGINS